MTLKKLFLLAFIVAPVGTLAQDNDRQSASATTQAANSELLKKLPFSDADDFELADRGFIAQPSSTVVRNSAGKEVWNMAQFDFEVGDAPATVNPSLWRQAKLNGRHGLYQVSDRIYQVRGFDISNLSVIVGETGYIIVDPLLSEDVAAAAMEFVFEHLPKKPVVAVIYSHSHADHFGGVRGVINDEDVANGNVRVIASAGFMDFAVSENILAGNVMTRRASYMFGSLLPRDAQGTVDVGLGKTISTGQVTLIEPTEIVEHTGEELEIDGVHFVFINAPYAEAPAELMFFLPELNAFYAAEEANGTLHNLYTLRGAQVRDALLWSRYLHEAIDFIPNDTDVLFGGHHWPRWGYDRIVEYLGKQGDAYRYIHDQTLRLANHGFTMDEISEQLELPPELANAWYNRGYYGTVSHNARAVYNKYLGFFDGNPANMHPLPPENAAGKYVQFMGGAETLLRNAHEAYERGEYRWVAEVVNHLVFSDPTNTAARSLQADALEQLGYQSESGQWRNFYLTAAQELRAGINTTATVRTTSPDMIRALPIDSLFDYLGVRLNGPKVAGQHRVFNFVFGEDADDYVVTLKNGVLHHASGHRSDSADVTVTLSRDSFVAMMLAGVPLAALESNGAIQIDGDGDVLAELIASLDSFEFWFNIVTP